MPITKAVPVALASALLFAPPVAFAAQNTAAPAGHESRGEHESQAEMKAFAGAKVPLIDAIAAAEKHSNGKALDVSFETNRGHPAYKVKTYQNGTVWEGMVDATSGQVVGQGKTIEESKLDREDKAEIDGLKGAKTSLADAVKTAEQKVGGKAIDAGLEETGGKVAFEMEIVKNGRTQRMMVDPQRGQIASASATPVK